MTNVKINSSKFVCFRIFEQRQKDPWNLGKNFLLFTYFICWLLLLTCPVVSDSLWPHGQQHSRHPCPSPSPGVCPSSCSLHWWWCPAISSSDTLFSFCPQSSLALGTFPMSHLFISDDQNTGASASVFLMIIQSWFPLRLMGLISLLAKGLSGVFYNTTAQRYQFFGILPSLLICW